MGCPGLMTQWRSALSSTYCAKSGEGVCSVIYISHGVTSLENFPILHFSLYYKLWQLVIILTLQAINLGVSYEDLGDDCKSYSYKEAEI